MDFTQKIKNAKDAGEIVDLLMSKEGGAVHVTTTPVPNAGDVQCEILARAGLPHHNVVVLAGSASEAIRLAAEQYAERKAPRSRYVCRVPVSGTVDVTVVARDEAAALAELPNALSKLADMSVIQMLNTEEEHDGVQFVSVTSMREPRAVDGRERRRLGR